VADKLNLKGIDMSEQENTNNADGISLRRFVRLSAVLTGTPVLKKGNFEGVDDKNVVLFGGDDSNPTWEEYVEQFVDEFKPRMNAIRDLVKEEHLVGERANNFCNGNYFEFPDGMKIGFSWRAWGDFMQALVGKREGYMTYYM
jgi:hypothetical protein